MTRSYSWKTTTAGILGVAIAVLSLFVKFINGEVPTQAEILSLIGLITVAIGLIKARDDDKTSREVGATDKAIAREIEVLADK